MREERQFERRGKQSEEFRQHLLLGRQRGAEIAMQQLPDIGEELSPDRQVEPELVAEHGEPFGRNAVLADARLRPDRRAPDGSRRKSRTSARRRSGSSEGCGEGNTRAWAVSSAPASPVSAGKAGATPLLNVDAFECMRAERALLVAGDIGAHRLRTPSNARSGIRALPRARFPASAHRAWRGPPGRESRAP